MDVPFAASPDDRFSCGLWTVGRRGQDRSGMPTRPPIEPGEIVARMGEVGAWGLAFHDDDLVRFARAPVHSGEPLAAVRAEGFSELLARREGPRHEPADQLMIEVLLGV